MAPVEKLALPSLRKYVYMPLTGKIIAKTMESTLTSCEPVETAQTEVPEDHGDHAEEAHDASDGGDVLEELTALRDLHGKRPKQRKGRSAVPKKRARTRR